MSDSRLSQGGRTFAITINLFVIPTILIVGSILSWTNGKFVYVMILLTLLLAQGIRATHVLRRFSSARSPANGDEADA